MSRRHRSARAVGAATVALTLALMLSACASSGGGATSDPSEAAASARSEPSATATRQASPAATPAPTPTPQPTIDVAALGDAYVGIADRLYEASQAGYADWDAATGAFEIAEALMALQDAYAGAARDLEALEFPAAQQADQTDLVATLDALAAEFEAALHDPTYPSLEANLDRLLPRLPEIGARIRVGLGLPPPITAPPG